MLSQVSVSSSFSEISRLFFQTICTKMRIHPTVHFPNTVYISINLVCSTPTIHKSWKSYLINLIGCPLKINVMRSLLRQLPVFYFSFLYKVWSGIDDFSSSFSLPAAEREEYLDILGSNSIRYMSFNFYRV